MKKVLNFFKWVIIIAIIVGLGWAYVFKDRLKDEKEISRVIEKSSDLTSAKMIYTGIYKSGKNDKFWDKIPFLTDNRFSMVYTCDIRAGIDLSKVKVKADFNTVKVTVPKATIQDVKINPNKIELYDEHLSLKSFNNKQDMLDAEKAAVKYVKTKANLSDLLQTADQQDLVLIKDLLSQSIGDRKLSVKLDNGSVIPTAEKKK